jgi:hypothetical protein
LEPRAGFKLEVVTPFLRMQVMRERALVCGEFGGVRSYTGRILFSSANKASVFHDGLPV